MQGVIGCYFFCLPQITVALASHSALAVSAACLTAASLAETIAARSVAPPRPFFAKGLLCCRQGFFQLRDSAEKELLLGYPVLLPFSLSLLLHNRIYLLAPSFMFTCRRSRRRVARSIVLEISREGSWRWACLFAVARTLGCIIQ